AWIEEINKWAVKPDLAIYLDVPAEVVIKRLGKKRSVMETLENQRKVREVYLRLVNEGKLMLIDGNRSVKEIGEEILQVVLERLKNRSL
ncbi:dTMP kinase, partial [Candidatus Bathyarchaeota archaeon]